MRLLVVEGGDVDLLGGNTNAVNKKTGALLGAEDVGTQITPKYLSIFSCKNEISLL
jgi:hypothetical protein